MDKNYKNLYEKLPVEVQDYLLKNKDKNISEIRIRSGFGVMFCVNGVFSKIDNLIFDKTDIENIFYTLCDNTLFAYENQIANGYITLPGGHRIGIGGNFYTDGLGTHLIDITSLNIRIAQEKIFDVSNSILEFKNGLLIAGKPHSGKTTMLRSLCKIITNKNIVVCDERNELKSQFLNCDFISGINKAQAIQQAVRALNPDIIICDEIGSVNEAREILDSMHSGVQFICTVHSDNISDLKFKPNINLLLESGTFDKIILLSRKNNEFYIKEERNV